MEYVIPYQDLEVRHLGEMYENILEFNVTLADADRIRRRTKKGVETHLATETTFPKADQRIKKGDVYFGETALERKQTGSFYTPETLVHFLNQKAIIQPLRQRFNQDYRPRFEEFLKQAESGVDTATRNGALQSAIALVERFVHEVILPFKVCDPAMGSGHFLVNGANQITDLIVSLLSEIPSPEVLSSRLTCQPNIWRRQITRHCLYGVDLNPLAVNLAKLSLWLNCFASHHRLTFLDHHVRCGNSLIGIRSISQLATIPERKKESQKKKNQQGLLFDYKDLSGVLAEAAKGVASIPRIDEDDTGTQKTVLDEALERTSGLRPLADLYTAYLMDPDIPADDYKEIFEQLIEGKSGGRSLNPGLPEIMESIGAYRKWHRFFHWPFEFPDVFGPGSVEGFSACVGNPPWDTVLPNSQEFFSAYDPKFRSYEKQQAKRTANALMKNNPAIARKWEEYGNRFNQQIIYFKEPINYKSIGKIHINTYKLFLEHFFLSLCPGGQMGIVVPSGIYTDQGCQPLRKLFFNYSQVNFLYCFENRWPTVFNAVDGRFKFVTFGTQKGGKTNGFKCIFMEHDPDRLNIIDKNAMKLTFEQIKKLSPDTLSIMEFENQREIDIATALYHGRPLLGDYIKANWKSSFQDEFNITHDTELFMGEEDIPNIDAIPMWEGKQIWILNSEFTAPTRYILRENTKIKPTIQHTRVIYRSVASNTNERTFIPAIVPATFPTGNSVDACPLPPSVSIKMAVVTGTFVIDWILRKKVTTNLNKFITAQLPILDLLNKESSYIFELLLAMGSRLICTSSIFSEIWSACYSEKWGIPEFWYDSNASIDSYGPPHEQEVRCQLRDEAKNLKKEWGPYCGVYDRLYDRRDIGDRAQLRSEIDAFVAHLYGLSRGDFAYILDTFPVLKRKEEQTFGEFMSKRKCLEEYDRIAMIL